MATKFDIEDRWPELFVQLDETQRRAVVKSSAAPTQSRPRGSEA